MVSVGDVMAILPDGSLVAREKISARCRRAENCSLIIRGKGVAGCGCNSAVVSCAAASLAASVEDILGIL